MNKFTALLIDVWVCVLASLFTAVFQLYPLLIGIDIVGIIAFILILFYWKQIPSD